VHTALLAGNAKMLKNALGMGALRPAMVQTEHLSVAPQAVAWAEGIFRPEQRQD
jgi:hypothetical protein